MIRQAVGDVESDPDAKSGFQTATLFWALLGGTACALVVPFEPNLLEEGILLHIAQRLAHGEHLYRDVLAFTGPLPFEVLALLFRIFGEEIWVGRALITLLHATSTAAAFAIARRAGAGAFSHAAAAGYAAAPLLLFPLFSIYYYTTIAFHLSVYSVWAALRSLDSWRWATLAGVGVGAVAICKQPIGIALGLTTLAALTACSTRDRRRRTITAFVVGGTAIAAATLAGFAWTGILGDAIRALVVLPASLEETFDAPFLNLWPAGVFAPGIAASQTFYLPYFYILTQGLFVKPGWPIILTTQVFYTVPIAGVLLTALLRVKGPIRPASWFHAALLLAWLSNLYPRADWGHLAHVLPLGVAQICIVAGVYTRGVVSRTAAGIAVMAPLAVLIAGSGWAFWQIEHRAGHEDFGPQVGLRPVSLGLRGEPVQRVIDFLRRHTEPGDPVFVARAEPLLYFATGTRNPTPYPGVIPGIRREQERVILEALADVRYVVMSDIDQPAMTYYSEELPAVQEHLERYFRIPDELLGGEVHWLVVLEPGEDRGATAIDLLAQRGEAQPFLRDRQGNIEPARQFRDRISTKYNRRVLGFHLGPGGGGMDFEIEVPHNAVFQADAGLWIVHGQKDLYQHPLRSRIRASIGRDGIFQTIAEAAAMTRGVDWRRWTPLEADLSAWSGQRVTLRLELVAMQPVPEGQIGFLGSPRIALSADASDIH